MKKIIIISLAVVMALGFASVNSYAQMKERKTVEGKAGKADNSRGADLTSRRLNLLRMTMLLQNLKKQGLITVKLLLTTGQVIQ